jgi:hypothetical protein
VCVIPGSTIAIAIATHGCLAKYLMLTSAAAETMLNVVSFFALQDNKRAVTMKFPCRRWCRVIIETFESVVSGKDKKSSMR